MNKEKDFFKTCFNTVAGLEVKNENQAIAKEVILNEIENLQEENKELKEELVSANESITWWNNRFNAVTRDNKQLKDNWNDLKKYAKEIISTDNELYGTDLLDKMQELEQGSDNQ